MNWSCIKNSRNTAVSVKRANLWEEDESFDHLFVLLIQSASAVALGRDGGEKEPIAERKHNLFVDGTQTLYCSLAVTEETNKAKS